MSVSTPAKGQIWRRTADGVLVTIRRIDSTPGARDVIWKTVGKPRRNGNCWEHIWVRKYEFVSDNPADITCEGVEG